MSKKVKITQKELKGPDKFREAISNAVVFISDNYKKFLYGLGGVIIIVVAAFVVISIFESQKNEASSKFKEALDSYDIGKSEEALGKFLAIRNEYPDADISKIALYYAATINYDMGKYDESVKLLDDFLGSDLKDQTLRDAAYLTLGLSSFNEGKWQEAIDSLSKLEKGGSPFENQAKLHIGLSLERLGRYSEAEKIYKDILSSQSGDSQGLRVE
jgi:hypothetical protein